MAALNQVPARGWHLRLEDTVLITADGNEVLTAAAPVDAATITRIYEETGALEWWKQRDRAPDGISGTFRRDSSSGSGGPP